MNERILIVEDDAHIRLGLREALLSERYQVTECANGSQVSVLVKRDKPQLILLDIMLPGKSGYDVCRELRSRGSDVPIIMITAKGQEIDKVVGFKSGADDYLTKPFGIQEVLARIQAVLRRGRKQPGDLPPPPHELLFGHVKIQTKALRGARGTRRFDLSARELKVLWVLVREAGNVVDRNQLLNEVWGKEYYGTTRTLDQVIVRLRQKIESNPADPRHILTIHGVGYRFQHDADAR